MQRLSCVALQRQPRHRLSLQGCFTCPYLVDAPTQLLCVLGDREALRLGRDFLSGFLEFLPGYVVSWWLAGSERTLDVSSATSRCSGGACLGCSQKCGMPQSPAPVAPSVTGRKLVLGQESPPAFQRCICQAAQG